MDPYDLCVLGAGPGGLSAAVRGAQRGARVCLVDPGPLGGACLNRGCIPARSLGTTARLFAQIRKGETFGIRADRLRLDLAGVLARKERILRRLRAGLSELLARWKVAWLPGEGALQGPQEVEVRCEGKPSQGLRAKSVILATGSRPGALPGCPVDGKAVVSSDELLELKELPASLIVVGAGVIGSEFASYFADLGVPVTLIEAADQPLPSQDRGVAEGFARSLRRRGVTLQTGVSVTGISRSSDLQSAVALEGGQEVVGQLVLVAAGRVPWLPPGTREQGVRLEEGAVWVDETLRTSVPTIFAVGDLIGGFQLAYTAGYEGALAAENALGAGRPADYRAVPEVIYTEPEIASVGLSEREALAQGSPVRVSRVPLAGFPRALTLEETEGFIQIVSDRTTGRLLGVQILGARATDLIAEAALAIRRGIRLEDLVETIHGHPTMSESLWEAAAAALGRSIYYAVGD